MGKPILLENHLVADFNGVRVVVRDPGAVSKRGVVLALEHIPIYGDSDVIDAQQSLDLVWRARCRQLQTEPVDGRDYRSPTLL
jgi:hypothetical protein